MTQDDLVKRLSIQAEHIETMADAYLVMSLKEAAARITALEAENKRLREEKEFAWDSGAHAALGLVGFEGWFGRLKNPYTAALEKK